MRDQSRRNGRQSEGGSEGGASPNSRSEARERTIWGTLWMPLTAARPKAPEPPSAQQAGRRLSLPIGSRIRTEEAGGAAEGQAAA